MSGRDDASDLPEGPDVSVAANYRDGCVWISLASGPRRCVEPEVARKIADDLDAAGAADRDDEGYEIGPFIKRIRQIADDVE